LKSAAARKRDYERTVERQVQKEREKEQGEFDDKEAFVTEAYPFKFIFTSKIYTMSSPYFAQLVVCDAKETLTLDGLSERGTIRSLVKI